jgi:hypothetical protein
MMTDPSAPTPAGSIVEPLYDFFITLHPLPAPPHGADAGAGSGGSSGSPTTADSSGNSSVDPSIHSFVQSFVDARGRWPVLSVPRPLPSAPMAVGFDDAIDRLSAIERLYAEPDGSIVWTSPREGLRWQVDGNLFERDGRVLLVDLKGTCPPAEFDRLLAVFDWPGQGVMMELVQAGVFLDERTFRRHARARGPREDGETLRPG